MSSLKQGAIGYRLTSEMLQPLTPLVYTVCINPFPWMGLVNMIGAFERKFRVEWGRCSWNHGTLMRKQLMRKRTQLSTSKSRSTSHQVLCELAPSSLSRLSFLPAPSFTLFRWMTLSFWFEKWCGHNRKHWQKHWFEEEGKEVRFTECEWGGRENFKWRDPETVGMFREMGERKADGLKGSFLSFCQLAVCWLSRSGSAHGKERLYPALSSRCPFLDQGAATVTVCMDMSARLVSINR